MEERASLIAENIRALKASPNIQRGLGEFVSRVIDLYRDDLISVIVFGSLVAGDFDEAESDVNLLIVYSDLSIVDLERVADLSRHWLEKQKFAPRFLSRRNLDESARYFQVDFLSMRDAHVVLWGEDTLAGIEMRPAELRWQIAYEVKAMRMRIKQQFWRTANEPRLMRSVLVNRFTSLIHLMRALLLLRGLDAPTTRHDTVAAAVKHFGIERDFADRMMHLRQSESLPDRTALIAMFSGLMDMVRTIDTRAEEVKL